VLSIHRAKGLDWQHVYLIATDRGAGRADPRATRIERRGRDLGLVLLDFEEPGLPALAAERALVEAAERVRLLYVATTRAKLRLVIGTRDKGPVDWRHATTQSALLAHRPAPTGWREAALRDAGRCQDDEHGVRWRLIDAPPGEQRGASLEEAPAPDETRLAQERETLDALHAEAEARARRPFATTASAEAHAREERAGQATGEVEPPSAAAFPEPPGAAAERSVARAAGTAVHALLEEAGSMPQGVDADTRLRQCVARVAAPGEFDAVLAHARAVWERFASGPLAARLADLAPHVVARELPVWVTGGEGENDPVGFVAGAIDLLYRDPESGALVVADYKTDATTAAESEAHAERYRAQGAAYVRAVTRALALPAPPRFELWFLTAGVVRTLDP
jgi:ATP-dependent exoDNAse (exonuclease V) beta subunit